MAFWLSRLAHAYSLIMPRSGWLLGLSASYQIHPRTLSLPYPLAHFLLLRRAPRHIFEGTILDVYIGITEAICNPADMESEWVALSCRTQNSTPLIRVMVFCSPLRLVTIRVTNHNEYQVLSLPPAPPPS